MIKFFHLKGSIGRKEYFFSLIFASLFSFFGILISAGLGKILPDSAILIAYIIVFLIVIPASWITIAAAVKRTRDTGISLWWLMLLLIPIANAIIAVFLLFAKSQKNREINQINPIVSDPSETNSSITDKPNDIYEEIAKEIDSKNVNKGLWLKALVMADGNEMLQPVKYTELRILEWQKLPNKDEFSNALSENRLSPDNFENTITNPKTKDNSTLTIILGIILIVGILIWASNNLRNTESSGIYKPEIDQKNASTIKIPETPTATASNQDFSILLENLPKATSAPKSEDKPSDLIKEIALAGITKDLLPNCSSPSVLKTVEEIVNDIDFIKNSNNKFVSTKSIKEKKDSQSNAYKKRDCRGILITSTIDYNLNYRITWDNKEEDEWYVYVQIMPLR
jgi:uncharacterized membrane protein YhaH (DUF805 family)